MGVWLEESGCLAVPTKVLVFWKITESKLNIALPGTREMTLGENWFYCFVSFEDYQIFFSLLSFNFLSEFSSCLWAVLVTLLPPHACTHMLRNLQVPELHGFLSEGHKDERFSGFLSPPLLLFPSFHFLSPKKNPTEQYFFSWSCYFCWRHWCCRSLLMGSCLWPPFHMSPPRSQGLTPMGTFWWVFSVLFKRIIINSKAPTYCCFLAFCLFNPCIFVW